MDDDDALSAALQTRRIPHDRKSAGGAKKHRGGGGFEPLRTLGRYEITLGGPRPEQAESWLEIHEFTPDEDGLLGTTGLAGEVEGVCLFAGSRKGLKAIVRGLEEESESEEEGGQEAGSGEDEDVGDDDSTVETADDRRARRRRNFEKNSFRNPKFWMQWKGRDGKGGTQQGVGYLVFAGNDCERFDGTISCEALQWDNRKWSGRKVRPRPTPCPTSWAALDADETSHEISM